MAASVALQSILFLSSPHYCVGCLGLCLPSYHAAPPPGRYSLRLCLRFLSLLSRYLLHRLAPLVPLPRLIKRGIEAYLFPSFPFPLSCVLSMPKLLVPHRFLPAAPPDMHNIGIPPHLFVIRSLSCQLAGIVIKAGLAVGRKLSPRDI